MSLIRRVEVLDPLFYEDVLFTPKSTLFDSITDLIKPPPFRRIITQIDETTPLFRRMRVYEIEDETPSFRKKVKSLTERVAELETRFERALRLTDGKYTCTAEIEGADVDRKYKWTAEMKGGRKKEEKWTAQIVQKKKGGNKYKWTTEIKGAEDGDGGLACTGSVPNRNKKTNTNKSKTRVVEIEDNNNANANANENDVDHHGALVLKQAFASRSRAAQNAKGKKKELSPQDAAMVIQMSFRAYLIHRSMALRALRQLAVAKTKLKEIRAFFNNYSYRRRVAQDAEERQKYSEKIIVLLLTVDAIEGVDLMVRGAKRSMIDELEAMLDVIDPQPCGKSLSMRRRTFDMPDGVIRKEIAEGVAQVVQMLDGEENSGSTFEACL